MRRIYGFQKRVSCQTEAPTALAATPRATIHHQGTSAAAEAPWDPDEEKAAIFGAFETTGPVGSPASSAGSSIRRKTMTPPRTRMSASTQIVRAGPGPTKYSLRPAASDPARVSKARAPSCRVKTSSRSTIRAGSSTPIRIRPEETRDANMRNGGFVADHRRASAAASEITSGTGPKRVTLAQPLNILRSSGASPRAWAATASLKS